MHENNQSEKGVDDDTITNPVIIPPGNPWDYVDLSGTPFDTFNLEVYNNSATTGFSIFANTRNQGCVLCTLRAKVPDDITSGWGGSIPAGAPVFYDDSSGSPVYWVDFGSSLNDISTVSLCLYQDSSLAALPTDSSADISVTQTSGDYVATYQSNSASTLDFTIPQELTTQPNGFTQVYLYVAGNVTTQTTKNVALWVKASPTSGEAVVITAAEYQPTTAPNHQYLTVTELSPKTYAVGNSSYSGIDWRNDATYMGADSNGSRMYTTYVTPSDEGFQFIKTEFTGDATTVIKQYGINSYIYTNTGHDADLVSAPKTAVWYQSLSSDEYSPDNQIGYSLTMQDWQEGSDGSTICSGQVFDVSLSPTSAYGWTSVTGFPQPAPSVGYCGCGLGPGVTYPPANAPYITAVNSDAYKGDISWNQSPGICFHFKLYTIDAKSTYSSPAVLPLTVTTYDQFGNQAVFHVSSVDTSIDSSMQTFNVVFADGVSTAKNMPNPVYAPI